MKSLKWALFGITCILVIAIIICIGSRFGYYPIQGQAWETLDTGYYFISSGDTQIDAAYLFNEDAENLRQLLKQSGIETDVLKTISFDNNSIVVLVRQWIPLDLKSVTVINHSATILEWDYLDEPYSAPAIPTGKSIRKVIVLKIPKSYKINVIRVIKKGSSLDRVGH